MNGAAPAESIEVARSFMTAFPDIEVFMDDVVVKDGGVEYHWTFTGTNTGPDGTGKRVRISGLEEWTLGHDGLIVASKGRYDQAEYDRQLQDGSAPQLNAVGIVVSDMARSIAFYRLLGLDVPETPGEGHVDTLLPSGVRLMLDSEETLKSFRPDWERRGGNQLALAFECVSPAEVDEVYARAVAAGFDGEKEPWDAFWGQRYAQLSDPDGVPVDLYASL